jgi:carbon-monoxide dehydrogenase medium subunit
MQVFVPKTIAEALNILQDLREKAKIIAGGTDLIPHMRAGSIQFNSLVDIRLLKLSYIREETGYIAIGSNTTHSDILNSCIIQQNYSALHQACQQIAAPPVRNRGTIGGNLANASPAADTAPAFLVHNASVIAESTRGVKNISLDEFFRSPGKTALDPDELIVEVHIPVPEKHTSSAFVKMGKRNAMAIAVASAATQITLDSDGRISEARIALGSVAPTPIRATEAEAQLIGRLIDTQAIASIEYAVNNAARPISDIRASAEYRNQIIFILVKRALLRALEHQNAFIVSE